MITPHLDKVMFFFKAEPEGIIVAKDNDEIVGFVIVTVSMNALMKRIMKNGHFLKYMFKLMLGMYGFNIGIVGKIISAIFRLCRKSKNITENIVSDSIIWSLVVKAEKRKQGIGTELIKKACEYIHRQGISEIGIEVSPSNETAISVYKKCGFIKKGILQSNYGLIYMTKKLNDV
ncbi:TPA: GNAT family N-acetyltransferase [Candidatus Poribacteria bacterium]|nr:GNAT family N-acetyltransferase [Candidatus Poribacteria bacterium]